ncbi:hypothetical protein C0J52_17248 [Blattella germanica]|nr:hypothetical protein C0J52_17248 [Blattella germanica]
MNCGLPVAVLLAVTVSLATSEAKSEGRFQCAGYCKGSSKFKYTPGNTYVYDYTADASTFVRGATKEKSQLQLFATAHFYAISQCDLVLQLKNVQLRDSAAERSSEFSSALEKNSLHFSYQDGTVDELCPSDDPVWVLNIKRGILSAFQNTMHDLYSAREKRHETDVSGTCETKYDVALEEDKDPNKPTLVIGKMKNLLACSNRKEHYLSLQSSPYMSSQSLPLIKSQQRGSQVVRENIIWKATNNEIHTFQPFSKDESGAVTMVNQVLQFKTSHNRGAVKESIPVRRTTLLFEQVDDSKQKNEELTAKLLEDLVEKTRSGVEAEVPAIFSQLVQSLKSLTYTQLSRLFKEAADKNVRKFLLDAMQYITTGDGMMIMGDLFRSREITSDQMDSWFTSLAFQKKPTLSMFSSLSNLLDASPSANALLGISSLVHNYCQQKKDCLQEEQVIDVMRKIEALLGPNCDAADKSTQNLLVIALKAIGNAGIVTDSGDVLKKCLEVRNPIELKLAAISAYRRLPCNEKTRSHLLELYTKKQEDTELRIAAYLAVMQCPTSQTIRKIKDTLYSEDVNQVASFVWTHLTNLQETSSPWKQSIQALVSSDFLRNKFKTDVRKFSRNYEGSFFSEALNAGAAAESNVIFTPESYLPRSATLNLTLDVFGETLNVLEVGARAEGFEQVVESMFGPGGYFPDGAMNKMLKKLRDKSDTNSLENSINQLSEQFDAKSKLEKDPYASVYTRVFGNELRYSEFHGLKDILGVLNDASSFDIVRKFSREEDIDHTKSFILIDGLYSVPTCIGLPLNLDLNGTAVVSFKLRGHANIKDLFHLNSIDIEGSIIPSAAVEFVGTMSVDATLTKTGLRLVNKLHTNTYVDGKIKIQGGNLVELKVNVPRDKVELLEVSSQLFVLQDNQYVESKGLENRIENYDLCSTDFISSVTGMKPCMELTYVNTSLEPTAPYFPLTGPFKFRIDVAKVDTFSSYLLVFRQLKERQETSLSFHFDTPGSRIDRKLSAQYVIDKKTSSAKASLVSPFIKIAASGKVEKSDSSASLQGAVSLNDKELFSSRLGMRKSHMGNTGRYEPFFSLSYKKQLIADVTGKVNYIEGQKCSADLVIKGAVTEPVSISGDFSMNEDKYELLASIKSKLLTSSLHASFRITDNYFSTKATLQYQLRNSGEHTLNFSAKLQDGSRGSLVRDTIYVTLQMTQFPRYNTELSLDTQYSTNYFENNCKLVVGRTTWQTQQLYRYQSTAASIGLAVVCTVACPALDIEYGIDISHKVTNASISSHVIATVTPQNKLSAILDYQSKIDQHKLDVDMKSPWYKAGVHGLLTETAPGQHEVVVSSWWTKGKDMCSLNASGVYKDGSNRVKTEHSLDVSLTGAVIGQLSGGILSSSSSKNYWIQLDAGGETYLANITYVKDGFRFMDATLKLAEKLYSGSLVLLSSAVEKGFAIDLKLRKRLTMLTTITCDGERQGLEFELFWDKDANPNKKISLLAQAVGNRKEVLLEIPGRYLKGEVVTIPNGVIGLLEWADHQKISAQLEWNLDEGSAEITVKLRTPFPRLENLSLFATYTMLENEGIFVVDGSWQMEKLTLTTTVRRKNKRSVKIISHMESTIPSLEHLSFNVDHSSEYPNFKTVALLKYNKKQSSVELNWNSDKNGFYGDLTLVSPIQNFEYMKHVIKYSQIPQNTSGSVELNWQKDNRILGEFVISNDAGTSGAFVLFTPFAGYEMTSAEYNFAKFQDKNSTTHVKLEAEVSFKDHMTKFGITGSKSQSSVDGTIQVKTPFTDNFKLDVHHTLKTGKLNELVVVSIAEEKLARLYLDSEVNSVSNLQLSAGAQMPQQDVKITIEYRLTAGNLKLNCEGKWNDESIGIIATGKCESSSKAVSLEFNGTASGSILPQELQMLLNHTSAGKNSQTVLQLPYNVLLTNTLTINNALNWENKLSIKTPTKSILIENKQSSDSVTLEHKMTAKLNGQQASGAVSLVCEPRSHVIREARLVLTTPWSDPIAFEYILPKDNDKVLRPSVVLKFKRTKEIRMDSELSGRSILIKVLSPFYKPLVVNASYNFGQFGLSLQSMFQWDDKKFEMEAKADVAPDMSSGSGMFFVRHSDMTDDIIGASFGYNAVEQDITAHALGTFRDRKLGFDLSLIFGDRVYKGSLSVQTPFNAYENLSLSGQINLVKTTKLAVITFTRELQDVTLTGLFGTEVDSIKFSLALGSHIAGIPNFSIYGNYNFMELNSHVFDLTSEYEGKNAELSAKFQRDNESLLAEIKLRTPFHGFSSVAVQGFYKLKRVEKALQLHLATDSWKFRLESGLAAGNAHLKVELPFDHLKEISANARYGYNPVTQERTISSKVTYNEVAVDILGALLITDDGSMTAGLELTSPIVGYTKLKCSATMSASKNEQKSATVIFSKEKDDYAITGMFRNYTEARMVITTPLKNYEKIEAHVGFSLSGQSENRGNIFGVLEMSNTTSEIRLDFDINKANSFMSVSLFLPLLQHPKMEMTAKYDVKSSPSSVSFVLNKDSATYIKTELTFEKNRISGDIVTPLAGYEHIAISGSLNSQNEKKIVHLQAAIEKHSLYFISTMKFGLGSSELQAELVTDFLRYERIAMHGQYDFQQKDKTMSFSLSLDAKNIYELLMTGAAEDNVGRAKIQVYSPISEYDSLSFDVKYDFRNDYSASFIMDKNGEKDYYGGHVAFTSHGTAIRIETPFEQAKDISLQGSYYAENDERLGQLKVLRNGQKVPLEGSFNFEAGILAINVTTPFDAIREIVVNADLRGLMQRNDANNLSLTVLRNSECVVKLLSELAFDWAKEIEYKFEFQTVLLPNNFGNLSLKALLVPSFPPSDLEMLAIMGGRTVFDLKAKLVAKQKGITLELKSLMPFATYKECFVSFEFHPSKAYLKFNIDLKRTDKIVQYAGDFKVDKASGDVIAVLAMPDFYSKKFSFQWKCKSNAIYSELETPIVGFEKNVLSVNYELKTKRKSAAFLISNNDNVLELRTSLEQTRNNFKVDMFLVTPLSSLQKFIIFSQYSHHETKKSADVQITINDNSFNVSGLLLMEPHSLNANLDVLSTVSAPNNLSLLVFCDKSMSDGFSVGGKLKYGAMSGNISVSMDYNLLEGEISGAFANDDTRIERRLMWNIENDKDMKSLLVAVNLGDRLNFAFNSFLKSNTLKEVEAQLTVTKFPIGRTSSVAFNWNVTNLLVANAGFSIKKDETTEFSLMGNIDLEESTVIKVLHIENLGFPFSECKIHIDYTSTDVNKIELSSQVLLSGLAFDGSFNLSPQKANATVKFNSIHKHFHFFLGYDISTQHKLLDAKCQNGHRYYELGTNFTLNRHSLPVVDVMIKTPMKHLSRLHVSNQYIVNETHAGFRVFLEKNEDHQEMSLVYGRNKNQFAIEGNVNVAHFRAWQGIANVDMSSGLLATINIVQFSETFFSADVKYLSGSLKARAELMGDAMAECILDLNEPKTAKMRLAWGDSHLECNGTVTSNTKIVSSLSVYLDSSKTHFSLVGKHDSQDGPFVSFIINNGGSSAQGRLMYAVTDSYVDIDFSSEIFGKQYLFKALYDDTAKAQLNIQFSDIHLHGNGIFSNEQVSGKIKMETPFDIIRTVNVEGEYRFYGRSLLLATKWNDKLFSLQEQHTANPGELMGTFNIVTPFFTLENANFDVKYSGPLVDIKIESEDKSLSFIYTHLFQKTACSVHSTLMGPSTNLSLGAELNIEKSHVSVLALWNEKKVNLSASVTPTKSYFELETPLQDLERVSGAGEFKNLPHEFVFTGTFGIGNEMAHVLLRGGKIISGQIDNFMFVGLPTGRNISSAINIKVNGPNNLSAKFVWGGGEEVAIVEGMLNLNNLEAKLNIYFPHFINFKLAGKATCRTWKYMAVDVKLTFGELEQLKTLGKSSQLKVVGTYEILDTAFGFILHAEDEKQNKIIDLDVSYNNDENGLTTMRLSSRSDHLTISYNARPSLKVNISVRCEMLGISNYSLLIEASSLSSSNIQGLFSYNVNSYAGGASFSLAKTKNDLHLTGNIYVVPFYIPMNHSAELTFDQRGFVDLAYEGRSKHKISILYEMDENSLKVTTDFTSNVLVDRRIVLSLQKDWKALQFEVINVFSARLKMDENAGSLIAQLYDKTHKFSYRISAGNDYSGQFTLESPYLSNQQADCIITLISDSSKLFWEAKYVSGLQTHLVALEISTSKEQKQLKVTIVTPKTNILCVNASYTNDRDKIWIEAGMDIMGTLSTATFEHKKSSSLYTELKVVCPYLPRETVQVILNSDNKSKLFLSAGYGGLESGYYVVSHGSVFDNGGEVLFKLNVPLFVSVQFNGLVKVHPKDSYALSLTGQYASRTMPKIELATRFQLDRTGVSSSLQFVLPGRDSETYEAKLNIPFAFSNKFKPHLSLILGTNHRYSLQGTYVNLEDFQEVGFGVEYKLRKLGTSLKIGKSPVYGVWANIDLPLGDNTGHYGIDFKTNQFREDERFDNRTIIGFDWDGKRIELLYSLKFVFTTMDALLNSEENVQCTLILHLTSPFQGYEKIGLSTDFSFSPTDGMIITSLNYPGSTKPLAFEMSYGLKSRSDASVVVQLRIPFVPALEDVATVISIKIDRHHGKFRTAVGGHWNKEKLAIHLEGNLKEELIAKGSMTLMMFGQTYSLESTFGSYGKNVLARGVANVKIISPLTTLRNVEVQVEIDMMKALRVNVTHDDRELLLFHVYTNEVTFLAMELRNPWKSVDFILGYEMGSFEHFMIQAEVGWNIRKVHKSKLGIVFLAKTSAHGRQETSLTLKLPTRTLALNWTQQYSSAKVEYAGALSWQKDQFVGFKTMISLNASSENLALEALGRLDLPSRAFEVGCYAKAELEASVVQYAAVGTEFLWDAVNDRSKKIGIELKRYSPIFEIVLKHVALKNDLKIRVEKNGKLSYNELPFTMKFELEYSDNAQDLITVEAFVQPTKSSSGLDMGFSLCHLASSIDFKTRSEIVHSNSDNSMRLYAEYLHSQTGQNQRLEFLGKMSLVHPEVRIGIKTAENLIEAHGLVQSDVTDGVSVLFGLLMNQKEPLSFKATVAMTEPRIEAEARYGDSQHYKAYAKIPHSREIAFGIKHQLYENEFDDFAVLLQLNTSQLLWSRVKWQPRALADLKSSFFQEYADIFSVMQSMGNGFSEVWLKDVSYKYNAINAMLTATVDQVVSTTAAEVNNVYEDFVQIGDDVTAMYRRNDFYLRDLQPYANKLITYIKEKATGIWKIIFDAAESIYSAMKDVFMMIVDALQIDLFRVHTFLKEIKVAADRATTYIVKFIQEIKKMHASAKEYLKVKIETAREQLTEAEENMKKIITDLEHYVDDLLTDYVEMLEPYLTYFENTMEMLSRRVIDFEDKISEYVLDVVNTVLGAQEVQELMEMYNKYSSWFEELHLREYTDKIIKFFESVGKLVMSDIRRVCADYLGYVDHISEVVHNFFNSIKAMPVIAYTRRAVIMVYEKAKWVWQHYKLGDLMKDQVHNWIENLDKVLLELLNALDMDASSPTKSLTPSITLRPDIGLIEYSQKLPIDWHGFNELPKFEQLQLYEQAKDQANEIASLDKYKYFLMDSLHDITNLSLTSVLPPFSANGMVIGSRHFITFDKKFYNFAGECSYLLASDFLNNKFSVFVTYKMENKEVTRKALTMLIDGHRIEITANKHVTLDGHKVELPVEVGEETWIQRTGDRVTVHSDLGLDLECNLHYDFCSVELSGWYFGKTGGLLGTFDYEPTNDFQLPNGTAAESIEAFANGWQIGRARCRSVNHAILTEAQTNAISADSYESSECLSYFENQLSPLRPCFSRIDVQPYLQMCLSEKGEMCLAVAAYVSQCKRASVEVIMPHKCVHCTNSVGETMNGGELRVFDGVESTMADVVFVVEQGPCIKNIDLVEALAKLDNAMSSQGLDTRLQATSSSDTEDQNAFDALWHASRLPFRETASKTILLIQCTSCKETQEDYNDMLTTLLEHDITLHMLQPQALKLHSGHGKSSKVYGVDLNGAFSGRNLKNLAPSLALMRQVALPKDLCTPLAFETNGTLFNMDRLLQSGSGANRVNMKKFLDIWARRVTLTGKPSQCQKCECVANEDGVGQIMCSKCLSPVIEQYLKEWENLKTQRSFPSETEDYAADYPI